MSGIRTVTTLRSKRAEILASITLYEKRLAQARADLAHVTACISIFEASGDQEEVSSYVDTHRLFARGELITLCKQALARGPKTTKELALHVMAANGLDTGDKVLVSAMASRIIRGTDAGKAWRNCQRGGKGKGGAGLEIIASSASTFIWGEGLVLRKTVAYRVVQALTMAERRGKVPWSGKAKGVRI